MGGTPPPAIGEDGPSRETKEIQYRWL